jgi:hypothetical protein
MLTQILNECPQILAVLGGSLLASGWAWFGAKV